MDLTQLLGHIAASAMVIGVIVLTIYSIHTIWMAVALVRNHHKIAERTERYEGTLPPEADLPKVLVQLPVFNERDVVVDAIDALAALDWPRDRLEIQVLDDSTDDTIAISRATADRHREEGLDIRVVHRTDRTGYKAGALDMGMKLSTADYIAIFDADFLAPSDFLKKMMAVLLADDNCAMAQARWEHQNLKENIFTQSQSIPLDAHFFVEQNVRDLTGLPLSFNGTCGIWRRQASDEAGGWTADTLSEDLDLSYRAQLAGWNCAFRSDIEVPGELPNNLPAWKQQQFRWSKGCTQVGKKLGWQILTSDLPFRAKLSGIMHVTHSLAHPAAFLLIVSAPAVLHFHYERSIFLEIGTAASLILGLIAAVTTAGVTRKYLRKTPLRDLFKELPMLLSLSTGMTAWLTRAVMEGIIGKKSAFVRTPKQGQQGSGGSYALGGVGGWTELAIAAWAFSALFTGLSILTPLLFIFCSGFIWNGLLSMRVSAAERVLSWWFERTNPGTFARSR